MLDDLDLAWEDQEPGRRRGGPPSRQARRRRRTERKRRRRSFGALFISFVLLVVLGGGVYYGVGKLQDILGAPDYTSMGTTPVNVKIPVGAGAQEIGDILQAKDVVKSAKAFVKAAAADDPASRNIQAGTYRLFIHMPAANALQALLQPDKYMVSIKVLIPEGSTVIEIFQILSKATSVPLAEFQNAAKDPLKLGVPDWWYNRQDGKDADTSLEGFLFPDTYRFDPDATATDILKQMVNNFLTVTADIKFVDTAQQKLSISPYEALIVASLAQAEAGNNADMPKIARVAYNRTIKFKDTFPCSCLQFDVTANYWLERQGKPKKPSKDLTPAELNDPKNPWNTAPGHPGLPLGPIGNPGKAALLAAINPTSANYLYFVVIDKKGTTAFADTLAQHEANIALARKNGVL